VKLLLLASANSAHTQRWANAFAARGVELIVASQHAFDPADFCPSVRIIPLPFRGGAGYFLNAPALRQMIRKERPDILHAHFLSGYGTTARLARFHPLIISVWGSDIFEFPRRNASAKRLIEANLRSADRLMSTSAIMKREIEKYILPRREIALTPFGVETDVFIPSSKPSVRHESASILVIGLIKDLEWYSGADVLLRAFARLAEDFRKEGNERAVDRMWLRIAGDGSKRVELESLAKNLRIEKKVEFLGFLRFAEVPAFFSGLDIYCAPSLAESFGVAALEASSCALPVVASRVGGLPEVVDDGRTGLLVEPGDEIALAGALRSLLLDADLRSRLGSAGRSFVQERYSWPSCVDRVMAIYEELSGRGVAR
jgi:glycosyltransferase involved in cell wall biosynthesis